MGRKAKEARKFTREEDDLIRRNYSGMSSIALASMIGCTRSQLEYRKCLLGLSKYRTWTMNDIEEVRKMYMDGMQAGEIAKAFGVGRSSIYQITSRYGIRKWRLVFGPDGKRRKARKAI